MHTILSLPFLHVRKTYVPVWIKINTMMIFSEDTSIKFRSLIICVFEEDTQGQHLIKNFMKTLDIKLSERPVNIALVQCRIDPKNRLVPLQE
jgi:hypothetical protein